MQKQKTRQRFPSFRWQEPKKPPAHCQRAIEWLREQSVIGLDLSYLAEYQHLGLSWENKDSYWQTDNLRCFHVALCALEFAQPAEFQAWLLGRLPKEHRKQLTELLVTLLWASVETIEQANTVSSCLPLRLVDLSKPLEQLRRGELE